MENTNKQFEIAVDDFGLTLEATRAILDVVRARRAERVGVMMNGSFTPEQIKNLCSASVKLDIHLDFDSPVCERRALKEGVVRRIWATFKCFLQRKIGVIHLESVWDRQIEDFKKRFGRVPDGINSHQHIHFFPAYFKCFIRLAKRHGIGYIRLGSKGLWGKPGKVITILRLFAWLDRRYLKRSGVASSAWLGSLDWQTGGNIPKTFPRGGVELVVHPERPEEYERIINSPSPLFGKEGD